MYNKRNTATCMCVYCVTGANDTMNKLLWSCKLVIDFPCNSLCHLCIASVFPNLVPIQFRENTNSPNDAIMSVNVQMGE